MNAGSMVIREPGVEAFCVPMLEGGWKITSAGRGTTRHPHVGDPWLAVERHIALTNELSPAKMDSSTATKET